MADTVIKTPMDLTKIKQRLAQQYYVTPDQLTNDLYQMCENCRVYNNETTPYWECATRLEAFVRARHAEATVKRLPVEEEAK